MHRPPIGPVSAIERAIVCMQKYPCTRRRHAIASADFEGFLHTATSGAAPGFFYARSWMWRRPALGSITGHLPSGATNVIGFAYSLLLSYWFLAGMTCYAVSIGSWMIVLAKTEVSLAYPLLSIGYIMTAIVGYYFLGENVNLARSGGIALICFGTLLISRSA